MAKDTLNVLANPYSAIDHDGIPSGTCPADPQHGAGALRWPGARIDVSETRLLPHPDQNSVHPKSQDRSQPQITRWAFSAEPEVIPATHHYVVAVRDGDLVAADEPTAKRCGIPFVEPMLVLATRRLDAILEFKAAYNKEPAFAKEPKLDPWAELAPVSEEIARQRAEAKAQAAEAAKKAAAEAPKAEPTRKNHAERAMAALKNLVAGKK